MTSNIVYCGLDCEKCPIYIATKTNDEVLREETAKQWNLDPSSLYCEMCNSEEGHLFYWCADCPIRSCARQNGFETCAECFDYPCSKLAEPFEKYPEHKENLDRIREKIL